MRKYEITQKLGKGAYAVVFKGVEKKSKEVVAIKKIFDAFQNSTDAQRTFREIAYLLMLQGEDVFMDSDAKKANAAAPPPGAPPLPGQPPSAPRKRGPHPNIIKLRNFHKAENDKDIYLVFDYMETDLHAVIRANILEPVHKQFIVYQTLKALKYCHSGGLLHRDLKPSNLLLNEDCVCKVADFGLARAVKEIELMEQKGVNTTAVLTDYVATRWCARPLTLTAGPDRRSRPPTSPRPARIHPDPHPLPNPHPDPKVPRSRDPARIHLVHEGGRCVGARLHHCGDVHRQAASPRTHEPSNRPPPRTHAPNPGQSLHPNLVP